MNHNRLKVDDRVRYWDEDSRPSLKNLGGTIIAECSHCGDAIVRWDNGNILEMYPDSLVKI